MTARLTIGCLSVVFLLAVVHTAARGQQNPYRLKEPDQRKLCLDCHTDLKQKLTKRFVHTAVSQGDCAGCHDPHVSEHGKLLAADERRICSTCHDGVVPARARSTHKVAADGECQKCHDPHASDNPGNLLAKGNDLCFGCHEAFGKAVMNAKFRHSPVEQGCLTCHGPHASADAARLLKSAVPGICVNCHKPDSAAFVSRHKGYPVEQASCTSCHDPHGSNQPALLLPNVHAPLSNGSCTQCHEAPDAAAPFATKRPGFELCKGCHADAVNAMLAKRWLHWPVADAKGCVNCHNPHAAKQASLLKADTASICGRCHTDTMQRIAATPVKHAPVQDGTCVACHSPHGSDGGHLIDQPSIVNACTTCHDYAKHSSHPIGEKAIDPRNKNLRVDCLSCHKGHGTEHKWMLLAATNLELCTRCHTKYVR